MVKKRRGHPLSPGQRYCGCAVLFGVSGRWPICDALKPKDVKGWNRLSNQPPAPPREITERQLEWAKRELAKAGWTLIMSPVTGSWHPVRVADAEPPRRGFDPHGALTYREPSAKEWRRIEVGSAALQRRNEG